MWNADHVGNVARVLYVLSGAAGALLLHGNTVVIELHGNADDVIALLFEQRSRQRTVYAAGHANYHPRLLRAPREIVALQDGYFIERLAHRYRLQKIGSD